MIKIQTNKMLIRFLTLVSRSRREGISFTKEKQNIILKLKTGAQSVPLATFSAALSDELVSINNNKLTITKTGISNLKRHLSDCDPHANQHRILQSKTVMLQNQVQQATINQAESPLARLYSRKLKDGTRFITSQHYRSGERLRCDFEKAQMQPSISATWCEGTSTGNTARGSDEIAGVADFAIDAHERLEGALIAIGPELAGITLDICCYLKGFEIVERERRWPARSGKLMLKTALAALSRHYGYASHDTTPTKKSTISQWGSSDYRPKIRPAGQYP